MLAIKKDWQKFKDARSGRRFKTLHARIEDYALWQRVLRAGVGVVVIVAGVVFLFIPGPGTLVMAFGIALLSGVVSPLAHAMDRAEPAVRHWLEDRKHGMKSLLHKAA